jgi:hypothetical protein
MATVLKDPAALRDAAEIRKGIELARQEIELSMTDLRNQVARTFDVRELIREHPFAVLGGACALGFALGFRWGE